MGYDKPRHLSFPGGATGGRVSAPIVKEFLKDALAGTPAVPFRVPPGIKLVRVDLKTGMRAGPGSQKVILEAFKPGTAPPDNYAVVGATGDDYQGGSYSPAVSPDADRAVRSTGTGGLY
jgi:penicillin-binding protein 1A